MPARTLRIMPSYGLIVAHVFLAICGCVLAAIYPGTFLGAAIVEGIAASHILLLSLLCGMSRLSITRRCVLLSLGAAYLSMLLITVSGDWGNMLASIQLTIVAIVPLVVLTVASFLVSLFYAEIVPRPRGVQLDSRKQPFQLSFMAIISLTVAVGILLGLGHALQYFDPPRSIAFFCVAALIHAVCGVGAIYLLLWAGMTEGGGFKRCALIVAVSPVFGSVYPILLSGASGEIYLAWITIYFVAFMIIAASLLCLPRMGFSLVSSNTGSASVIRRLVCRVRKEVRFLRKQVGDDVFAQG